MEWSFTNRTCIWWWPWPVWVFMLAVVWGMLNIRPSGSTLAKAFQSSKQTLNHSKASVYSFGVGVGLCERNQKKRRWQFYSHSSSSLKSLLLLLLSERDWSPNVWRQLALGLVLNRFLRWWSSLVTINAFVVLGLQIASDITSGRWGIAL